MKYIQGIPTCLPTGREEISWNFACKVDKKYLSHNVLRVSEVLSGSEGFGRSAEGTKADTRLLCDVSLQVIFILMPSRTLMPYFCSEIFLQVYLRW